MTDVIISLTSYGTRLKLVPKTIFSILCGTIKPYKIVLTLYKEDLKFIPKELQLFIDHNIIELLIADENLKSHLKYFYCLQKYSNYKIITIDDDIIYPKTLIEKLLLNDDNESIIAYRGHTIKNDLKYNYDRPTLKNSHKNIGLGAFGILYQPHCFDLCQPKIEEIKNIIHNDDVYLKVLEIRNKKSVLILNTDKNLYKLIDTGKDNLHTENWKGRTAKEMESFNKDFEKLKLLE